MTIAGTRSSSAPRSEDALSSYVASVGSLEPLSRDREIECGRALRENERRHALSVLRAPTTAAVLDETLQALLDASSGDPAEPDRFATALEALIAVTRAPGRAGSQAAASSAAAEDVVWRALQGVDSWRSLVARCEGALIDALRSRDASTRAPRAGLVELAREASRARASVEAARRTLLEAHLRLVIAEAKRFVGRGVPLADLVQEGNLGLLDAADRFDPELGYRFNTYAMWWIRAKLRGAVARNGRTIRVPVRRLQAVSRLQRAAREAATELGREPTAAEVGGRLEIPEEEVERLLALPAEPLRLEGMDAGGEGVPIAERLADPDAIDPLDALLQGSRDDLARSLMGVLSEREASIIRDRFGFRTMEHTLDEIGRKMGVTRERIRQIEARALKKMRVVAERGESKPAHGGVSDATG